MTGSFERIHRCRAAASVERRGKAAEVAESLRAGRRCRWWRRDGLRSNQPFKWREMAREGAFGTFPADSPFVPVRIIGKEAPPSLRSSVLLRPSAEVSSAIGHSLVEIEPANGCRLRVAADIEPAALKRLVTALKQTG